MGREGLFEFIGSVVGGVGRGSRDDGRRCGRRPHPGTCRATRDVEHGGRGGCEPGACGADRIHGEWGRGTWLLRKAPAARFRIGNAIRGGTVVAGPTLFLAQRLTPLERQQATQRKTPRSLVVANEREYVTIVWWRGERGGAGSRRATLVSRIDSNESVAPSLDALVEPRHGLVGRPVDRITTLHESRPPQSRVTWIRSHRFDPASQTVVFLVVCRSILRRRQAPEQE
jgi:hypothetical protein